MSKNYAGQRGLLVVKGREDAAKAREARSRRRFWSTLAKQKGILIGGTVLFVLVVVAIFAPLIVTNDPVRIFTPARLRPPNAYYFFGTDSQGRDVFARVLYGARLSLTVGVAASVSTLIFGTLI